MIGRQAVSCGERQLCRREPSAGGAETSRGSDMIEVVYALWRRDMIKFLRDRRQLITSLTRPFLWLLAFGFGLAARCACRRAGPTTCRSWCRGSPP